MYLGSVRFFKHLIYIILSSLVLVLAWGTYSLGMFVASTVANRVQSEVVGVRAAQLPMEVTNNAISQRVESLADAAVPRIFPLDYQLKHKELYSSILGDFVAPERTVYLTFDDGPSQRTLEILDILSEYQIKATFFVITENADPRILQAIAAGGHTIGIHTHSHRYREIYRSVEDFLDDFEQAYRVIRSVTGVAPQIFRFPGGSINAYNRGIYQELIGEMLRRGFLYYDWNISTMDTDPTVSARQMVEIVTGSAQGRNKLILLAHDSQTRRDTVQALPEIIRYFRAAGYKFERLSNSVEPIVFAYPLM